MRFLSLFLIALTFAVDAKAVKTDHAEISIIVKNNIISEPGTIDLGYKFIFTPGWHTYWINPGDSGDPAEIEWELPEGFQMSGPIWPSPDKIPFPPLMTYGFDDQVILPFILKTPKILSLIHI